MFCASVWKEEHALFFIYFPPSPTQVYGAVLKDFAKRRRKENARGAVIVPLNPGKKKYLKKLTAFDLMVYIVPTRISPPATIHRRIIIVIIIIIIIIIRAP